MKPVIIMMLLTLLAIVTVAIIRQRNMYAVVILSGVYSFLMASVMLVLDAVDVAMTEASVGAGISTVILLATLHMTGVKAYAPTSPPIVPLLFSLAVGAVLVWGTFELPAFGLADTPIHQHTTPKYLEMSKQHLMPPNVVTAVLADFRSFDTMGEVTVIFTAGIGVLMLLRGRKQRIMALMAERKNTEAGRDA